MHAFSSTEKSPDGLLFASGIFHAHPVKQRPRAEGVGVLVASVTIKAPSASDYQPMVRLAEAIDAKIRARPIPEAEDTAVTVGPSQQPAR